ncbi:DHA2 family efflux MFS transporter permease subunit [Magnetospirillum sp. 15-1]|uniref:DHA2 family efflux MFS transporter permease subunit n=1 Tax=Magnetospirillum sp. 15-1 TaxID=1979370 RepID=UPI000BBC410E|nr:DHA2 family efflux MFS transporter permease subunit [Magnetospirillum sp. 15-1]
MSTSTPKSPITPLFGMPRALAAITLGLGSFMVVTDFTIANVSVPTISGDLSVSPDEGEWLITSYAIASAICIPLTGWLSRRFGQVRLFIASVTAFTIASILCGLAPSLDALLAFRVLQGAVSGPIVPLSQALLVAVFPAERQALAVAMWAMTNMAGPVAGPLLGGWITDQFTWPWIFLINVPVGIFVVASTFFLLRHRDSPTVKLPVDMIGFLLVAVAIGCLQVTLDRGRILDWFSSPLICVTAAMAGLGLIFLVVWELGDAHPIVDLRLFTHRNFAVGSMAVAVGFGLYLASIVMIPLWLQTDMDYNATWAGWVTAPIGVFGILLAPFLGRWVRTVDARLFASLAFVAMALVAWWRSTMTTEVDAGVIAMACLAQGVGIGFFLTPLVSLSFVGLPPDKVASASGLQNAIRMMSGSLTTSVAQTFWDQRARFHQTHLVETLTPSNENTTTMVTVMRKSGLTEDQVWAVIARQLEVQAHMLSLNDFFIFSTFAVTAGLAIIWFAHAPRKAS